MISRSSLFFRVDQVLKLSSSSTELNPVGFLRGYRKHYVLNYRVKMASGNDKKLKSTNPGWKIPISSQANSHKGSSSSGTSGQSSVSAKKHSTSTKAVENPSRDYTHFISLPLALHPELVKKLFMFQNSILGCGDSNENEEKKLGKGPNVVKHKVDNNNKEHGKKVSTSSVPKSSESTSTQSGTGIEKSIFINPKTFHLTVLMLKLWNKERVDKASKVLKNISSEVNKALDNRPISIRLQGLDCMRGSEAKAYVVHAPVEEVGGEGRLLNACHVIIEAFVQAGLVLEKDATRSLKLHATLMNARHRKRTKGTQKVDPFDAQSIFMKFGSHNWGEYQICEAHLSQRFAYDDKGYYHCCASIPFPENESLCVCV